jgi:uncharacterized protein (DUF885 family)
MRTRLLAALLLAMTACRHAERSPPAAAVWEQVQALAERVWEEELRRNPIHATLVGDRRFDHQLPDLSPAALAARFDEAKARDDEATRLLTLAPAHEDRVTLEVIRAMAQSALGAQRCELPWWDVNALDGVQTMLGELPELHAIVAPEHLASLVARYRAAPALIDQHLENLRLGRGKGFVATRVATVRVLAQLEAMLADEPGQSPFAQVRLPSDWTPEEQAKARIELARAAHDALFPALARYQSFLADEYSAIAREAVGVAALPQGAACYRALIRVHTGLDLAPEEIHQTGLAEAGRNLAAMRAIAQRLVGAPDIRAAKAHLERAQRVDSRQALLAFAERLTETAVGRMPQAFGRLPKQQVKVKPIEAFREAQAPTGYYYAGSIEEGRPGYFYLNTYKPEEQPLFLLEALTFHEAVPGHHLQRALAQELLGLPRFRRELGDGAFTEGWAHYAELLADELGLYSGDGGRLGMLSDQALRAARLVVDTGLHVLGWDRQRAVDYMFEHTLESLDSVEREVDRYIVWPGQALSYKLGQLEILALRAQAKEQLGARYDLKAFHDALLGSGVVPLPVARRQVERWLAAQAEGAPGSRD